MAMLIYGLAPNSGADFRATQRLDGMQSSEPRRTIASAISLRVTKRNALNAVCEKLAMRVRNSCFPRLLRLAGRRKCRGQYRKLEAENLARAGPLS
ncbi:hypothetical protein [Pseudomonas sp. CGJS7]|uniref:hypothetical protein n=1 Tax=Pseudomonas sp. CGJS7 TaxID=3109348 RepID=UPI0030086D38